MKNEKAIPSSIEKDKLELLYTPLKYSMYPSILVALSLTIMLKGNIENTTLITWISILIILALLRLVDRKCFLNALKQPSLDITKWKNRFIIGMFSSALTWGLAGVFLFPIDSIVHQTLVGLTLILISSSALGTLVSSLTAFILFIASTLFPFIIYNTLINDNSQMYLISILMVLHVLFTLLSGKNLNKVLNANLKYKYEAQKREDFLQENELKYRLLYEKSEDPMFLISGNHFSMANEASVELLGFNSQEQILNSPILSISPTYQLQKTTSEVKAKEEMGIVYEQGFNRFEWILKHKNGTKIYADVTLTLIPFLGEKAVFCIVRDISHNKKNERNLIDAKRKSEIANEAKSQFLANMSHEIRTPMNGIIGTINLQLQNELNPDQYYRAITIKNSAESLLSILNGILDVSKIEAGKIDLEILEFELTKFIKDFSLSIEQRVTDKNLTYTRPTHVSSQLWLKGDVGRISQILLNLIDNSIKFTPKGNISLSYIIKSSEGNHSIIEFRVTDTGLGLTQEQQSFLFERFKQADNSTTREYGGTGLGLNICKELSKLMGGDIGFESKNNVGSSFWFTVKLKNTPPPKTTNNKIELNKDTIQKFKAKVLIIDDNLTNRDVAFGMLKLFGLSLDVAEDGIQALSMLEKNDFDLVFMDCQMPVIDGFQTTKRIRDPQSTVQNHQIPIIAMTALAMQGDKEKCINSGMNDYVSKPFELSTLQYMLHKWLP